jgi:membrane-bound metal-dependent hydrolase YbcI (DUF457 family)
VPLTPFHLGPGILFGLLLLRYVDFPTFVVGSVVVDWRAALVYVGFWPGPRHGWMHTYLGSLAFSLLVVAVMIAVRPRIDGALERLAISQRVTTAKIAAGAFLAVTIHVTIDAFHHPTMRPLLPLEGNPLYGFFSTFEMRAFTAFCLFLGVQLYLVYFLDLLELDLRSRTTE